MANPVLIPILQFRVVNQSDPNIFFDFTVSDGSNPRLPSWITSFTYQRRANSMGAGTWTASFEDPTFTLIDIINKIYIGEQITNEDILDLNTDGSLLNSSMTSIGVPSGDMGRVSFRYGYAHAGHNIDPSNLDEQSNTPYEYLSEFIEGYILKISPSINSKHKLTVSMTGKDVQGTNPFYARVGINANYVHNVTLNEGLTNFLTALDTMDAFGIYGIYYANPELKDLPLTLTELSPTLTEGDTGPVNDNEGNPIITLDGSPLNGYVASQSFTLRSYMRYLEKALGGNIRITHEPLNISKTTPDTYTSISEPIAGMGETIQVPVIKVRYAGINASEINNSGTARYFVNTTESSFVLDGVGQLQFGVTTSDNRVIVFDPSIEPLLPSMFGLSNQQFDAVVNDSLDVEKVQTEVDNVDTSITGDALTKFELSDNIPPNQVSQLNPKDAIQQIKYMYSKLAYLPLKASMRVQFDNHIVVPYDSVAVYVTTPQGQLYFTTGLYMVTDIDLSINPGKYVTTYQLIRSGAQVPSSILPVLASTQTIPEEQ